MCTRSMRGKVELLLLPQRSRQPNPINRPGMHHTPILVILLDNQVLAVGIDKQTDQVGAHVMAALVIVVSLYF